MFGTRRALISQKSNILTGAALMLRSEQSGVGIDFLDNSMVVRDPVTFANSYVGLPFSKLSGATRASSGTFIGSNGLLQTAGNNVPRFDYNPITHAPLGVLFEPAATNLALWSNDLTQASWVKTNMTAALTKIGTDGIVNSATLLTATAPNATVLQTITQGSAAFVYGACVERVTGSGTISMTMDGGATYTAISPTAPWTKFPIPSQTLANPSFGFKITTNGDQIAVFGNQTEAGSISTSTIVTVGASATRAVDNEATLASSLFNLSPTSMTLFLDVDWAGGTSANP